MDQISPLIIEGLGDTSLGDLAIAIFSEYKAKKEVHCIVCGENNPEELILPKSNDEAIICVDCYEDQWEEERELRLEQESCSI